MIKSIGNAKKKTDQSPDIQIYLLRFGVLDMLLGSSHTFSVSVFGCLGNISSENRNKLPGLIQNKGSRHSKNVKGDEVFECLIPSSPKQRVSLCLDQWDFRGPPILGPLYGKFPILFPYHSHKNP